MNHRNFVRDAVYGVLHHCEQQKNGKYDARHPMSQTGQASDQLAEDIASLGIRLIEAALSLNQHSESNNKPEYDNEADVLAAATSAYQRGHITKQQYFAVINALDEPAVETTARATQTRKTNEAFHQLCLAEQREAQNYLNQYRR